MTTDSNGTDAEGAGLTFGDAADAFMAHLADTRPDLHSLLADPAADALYRDSRHRRIFGEVTHGDRDDLPTVFIRWAHSEHANLLRAARPGDPWGNAVLHSLPTTDAPTVIDDLETNRAATPHVLAAAVTNPHASAQWAADTWRHPRAVWWQRYAGLVRLAAVPQEFAAHLTVDALPTERPTEADAYEPAGAMGDLVGLLCDHALHVAAPWTVGWVIDHGTGLAPLAVVRRVGCGCLTDALGQLVDQGLADPEALLDNEHAPADAVLDVFTDGKAAMVCRAAAHPALPLTAEERTDRMVADPRADVRRWAAYNDPGSLTDDHVRTLVADDRKYVWQAVVHVPGPLPDDVYVTLYDLVAGPDGQGSDDMVNRLYDNHLAHMPDHLRAWVALNRTR